MIKRNDKSSRLMMGILILVVSVTTIWADMWYVDYENALKAIKKEEWQDAVALLHSALKSKREPKVKARTPGVGFVDYLPYYYLGLCYFRMGAYKDAQTAFAQSLQYGVIKDKDVTSQYKELRQMNEECGLRLNQSENKPRSAETGNGVIANPPSQPDNNGFEVTNPPNGITAPPLETKASNTHSTNFGTSTSSASGTGSSSGSGTSSGTGSSSGTGTSVSSDPSFLDTGLSLPEARIAASQKLNKAIDAFFFNEELKTEIIQLKEAAVIFTKDPKDKKKLIRTYQFLALCLLRQHYLSEDTNGELLREARHIITKIFVLNPKFKIETRYFSPKLTVFFKSAQK